MFLKITVIHSFDWRKQGRNSVFASCRQTLLFSKYQKLFLLFCLSQFPYGSNRSILNLFFSRTQIRWINLQHFQRANVSKRVFNETNDMIVRNGVPVHCAFDEVMIIAPWMANMNLLVRHTEGGTSDALPESIITILNSNDVQVSDMRRRCHGNTINRWPELWWNFQSRDTLSMALVCVQYRVQWHRVIKILTQYSDTLVKHGILNGLIHCFCWTEVAPVFFFNANQVNQ